MDECQEGERRISRGKGSVSEISICESLGIFFWRKYIWDKDCHYSSKEEYLELGIRNVKSLTGRKRQKS